MDRNLAAFKDAYRSRKPTSKPASESAMPVEARKRPESVAKGVPTSQPVKVPFDRLMLFKQAFGAEIRDRRLQQGFTLRDLAAKAAVSLGYLSEIERGLKEPSSEVIACVTTALGGSVPEMLISVAFRISDDLPALNRAPHTGKGREAPMPVAENLI